MTDTDNATAHLNLCSPPSTAFHLFICWTFHQFICSSVYCSATDWLTFLSHFSFSFSFTVGAKSQAGKVRRDGGPLLSRSSHFRLASGCVSCRVSCRAKITTKQQPGQKPGCQVCVRLSLPRTNCLRCRHLRQIRKEIIFVPTGRSMCLFHSSSTFYSFLPTVISCH